MTKNISIDRTLYVHSHIYIQKEIQKRYKEEQK